MNWQIANATAMLRAPQVHRDLRIDRSGYVDVFAALRASGIDCNARPLGRLFGFYYSPRDCGPAVLLNANLDEIDLRHTAAHELGHHVFGHGSQADTDLDLAGLQPGRAWTDVEKQAESFAAWFLMPPPAVEAAIRRVGIEQVEQPEQVYEIARWLGTSYAGTVRHLARLKKIPGNVAATWSRMAPQRLRGRLYRPSLDREPAHAFMLRPEAHGGALHVAVRDLVVLPPDATVGQLPKGIRHVCSAAKRPTGDAKANRVVEPAISGVAWAIEVTPDFRVSRTLQVYSAGRPEPFIVTLVAPVNRRWVDSVWSTDEPFDPASPDNEAS